MIEFILYRIKKIIFKRKWRLKNRHNFTRPSIIFPINKVTVGKMTYGNLDVRTFGNPNEKLIIGDYVSISEEVKFILGGNHQTKIFSNFPLYSILVKKEPEIDAKTKGSIFVENEVWIGTGAMILSGVRISKGAIIGAGAVVSKDIPAYSIVGGNPATILKYRFPEDIRNLIGELSISGIKENKIIENINLFYRELDKETIEKLKNI